MGKIYQYDIAWVNQATRTDLKKRKSLVNWFDKQSENIQVEALASMLKCAKEKKVAKGMLKEHLFSSLIETLKQMHKIETKNAMERGMDSSQGRQLTDMRIERIIASRSSLKKSKKRDLILDRLNDISRMKEKGLSWREISFYLKKYHRINISHSYLQQQFSKMLIDSQ